MFWYRYLGWTCLEVVVLPGVTSCLGLNTSVKIGNKYRFKYTCDYMQRCILVWHCICTIYSSVLYSIDSMLCSLMVGSLFSDVGRSCGLHTQMTFSRVVPLGLFPLTHPFIWHQSANLNGGGGEGGWLSASSHPYPRSHVKNYTPKHKTVRRTSEMMASRRRSRNEIEEEEEFPHSPSTHSNSQSSEVQSDSWRD